MMAFCGLECDECKALIATKNNDDALRAEVAQEWATLYNAPIRPEHINCTGCRSEGVKNYYCEQLCKVRKCNIERGLEHCGMCVDFACDKIGEILKFNPDLQKKLAGMKG